jgi:hypothetical protein
VGRRRRPAPHTFLMRIILDITQDAAGRLTGTAGAADGTDVRPFYGAMELLNTIEELCEPATPGSR